MLAAQYTYKLDDEVNLVARGEWRYLGDQYFDLFNTIKQSGYHIINARAGFTTNRFDAFFWANNIFDKKYIDYAYDFGGSHLGNPAIYGVSLNVKF